ncbi:acyltransferase family protein [Pseudarthrobacter siccitolerans]
MESQRSDSIKNMSSTNLATSVRSAHIPSLDGLRALAVLVVFIGHGAVATALWPGHVGVTIFFFLSGYLIVTLLRREYELSGRISLRKFYIRRGLRILPPAYLAIAVSVLLWSVGLLPGTVTPAGVLAEVFHLTNYYIVLTDRYGLPPETTQLWSLSVEEHYYLVVPAVLLVLLHLRSSMRVAGWTLLAAGLLTTAWRILLGLNSASFDRLYVSTDTRIDSLLFGSAFALLMNPALGDPLPGGKKAERLLNSVLAPVAVFVFLGSAVAPSLHFRFSVADVVQCVCLVPIFWALITRPSSRIGRILNHRVVRHIGVLSFSIYLFHRIVLELVGQVVTHPIALDAISLILTLLFAEVVFRLVEVPLARVRRRYEAMAASRDAG